jgi:hypothetical protein
MNSTHRSLRAGLAVILSAAAGLAAAPAASAQVVRTVSAVGAPGPGGADRTITGAALDKYAGVLALDDAQRTAAKTFHEEYQRRVADADKDLAAVNKKMRELFEDGDHKEAMKKMGDGHAAYAKAKGAATEQLLGNLKALLTADQAARWDKLERLRRREGLAGAFMVAGASVDLIDVLAALKLPDTESAKVAGPLEEYERDFDRAITDYNRYQTRRDEEQKKKQGAAEDGPVNFDMEDIRKLMDEDRKEAGKLRDVNKSYVGRLGNALPEEWRKKLEKEWLARAYRRIFAEPHTLKQLKTAAGFGDLSAEQKSKVSEMTDNYQRELDSLNARWLEEEQKAEAEGKGGSGFPFMGDEDTPEGLKKAREARQELDRKFSKNLREILSEEQKERLPKRKNGGFVFPDGGEGIELEMGDGNVQIMIGGPG